MAIKSRQHLKICQRSYATMLTPETQRKLCLFHRRWCFQASGCLKQYDDHGPRGAQKPIIAYAPLRHSRIYTGDRATGSFNHTAQVAKFKGQFFCSWSNGLRDEAAAGQRILISSSANMTEWTEAVCIIGDRNSNAAHFSHGLMATEDTLYQIGLSHDKVVETHEYSMNRVVPVNARNTVYASPDGKVWKEVFSLPCRILEAPRLTASGRLMCAAATEAGTPAILRWPHQNLLEKPECVPIAEPAGARFRYAEASWYQTDTGTIIAFWRDEGESCRLWMNTSEDGGATFSAPVITDIPDSMSRLYAGRLRNGRFYLVSNAFPELLNRRYLTLLMSDDGYCFNKVYLLRDDPTSQRCIGLLKADGYQYPCCIEEEDRLVVAYSINKEDIECAVVDIPRLN